ncbi:hypothetical protein, partial [Pseudomonas viridiflava]|uniref:hypothetical protein n=1 Tax=Pseudomonas viridiflava TaxID=33069 RepID=UPI0019D0DC96
MAHDLERGQTGCWVDGMQPGHMAVQLVPRFGQASNKASRGSWLRRSEIPGASQLIEYRALIGLVAMEFQARIAQALFVKAPFH